MTVFFKPKWMSSAVTMRLAVLCVLPIAIAGCGGGGGGSSSSSSGSGVASSTPSPDFVTGAVTNSSAPAGTVYTVSFDHSTVLETTTSSSGAYSLEVPVSSITGSDSIYVLNSSNSILAIQPVTSGLSTSGGADVVQNVQIIGSPPSAPTPFVK